MVNDRSFWDTESSSALRKFKNPNICLLVKTDLNHKQIANLRFMNYYGFFIALGILAGLWVAEKIIKKFPISDCRLPIAAILAWILIPGIIGARFYHVIDYWKYYRENLREIFFIWHGGLGIFGGIFGGLLGLYWYCFTTEVHWTWQQVGTRFLKRINFNKINEKFLELLDLGVVGLVIGQAIGRWGNFFNQELYGWPTNLPWGIYIRPENRLPDLSGFERFHPLFLYESLGCFLIFCLLIHVLKSSGYQIISKNPGAVSFLYFFLYSLLRFWLEFLRPEGWMVNLPMFAKKVRMTQVVTLSLMVILSVAFVNKFVKIKRVKRQ